MFGTMNWDMRSSAAQLRSRPVRLRTRIRETAAQLQQTYIDDSDRLDPENWMRRSFGNRFLENTLRLVSPLL